jgi:hypothetical protein
LDQTNLQISKISSLNTPKLQKLFLPRTGLITPVTVLLFGQLLGAGPRTIGEDIPPAHDPT